MSATPSETPDEPIQQPIQQPQGPAPIRHMRFLAIIAVVGLSITTVATFLWSLAKSAKLIGDLLDGGWSNGGWRDDGKIVDLLEVVDSYLLAVVLLIVAIGLYELFIGTVDVPEWLRATSLDDLKKSIVDILIVFLGVKGVEGLLAADTGTDALAFSGAVAILIVALSVFRLVKTR